MTDFDGSDTLSALGAQIARALLGIRDLLSSDGNFQSEMRYLGWQVEEVPPVFDTVAIRGDALRAALEASNTPSPTLAGFEALFDTVGDFVASVVDLRDAVFDADLSVDDIGSHLPRQLVDRAVIQYLEENRPTAAAALQILGVIRARRVAAEGNRPAYVHEEIAWRELPELIRDSFGVFRRGHRWGEPEFDGDLLLQAIQDLFLSLGLPSFLGDTEDEQARVLEEGAEQPLSPNRFRLEVVVVDRLIASALAEAGLRFLPLPVVPAHAAAGLAILPYATTDFQERFPLADAVFLEIESSLDLQGGIGIVLRPGEPVAVVSGLNDPENAVRATGAFTARLEVERPQSEPIAILRSRGGSGLFLGGAAVGLGLRFNDLEQAEVFLEVDLRGASLVITPSGGDAFLQETMPSEGSAASFDVALGFSSGAGFYLRGSGGAELRIPVHVSVGGLEVEAVRLALRPSDGSLGAELGADVRIQLGPLAILIENVGVNADFSFPANQTGNLGPLHADLGFNPPTGLGLSIDGGGFKGGGFLSFDRDKERYAGVLELEYQDRISLKAVGLLTTRLPGGEGGFSLLVIITAEFTPIQLGFGFTLNGVGGLLGVNRTVVLARLRSGVKDKTLESILFPKDIVANANRIISDLRQVFPPTKGQFLIGPMAKIAWGTPTLITVDLGLVIELPDPVRIAILGVLKTLLPDENSKILRLQVNFLGVLDFEQEMLSFDASIFDSKLLSFTLSGDMALRIKWGNDPNFLLSVGGFHPAYEPPPLALPTMARLSISLLGGSNPRISVETYFAVTSNTVQFGAKAELYAGAGRFNIYGFVGFDVLFQFSPFYFNAALGGMLALRVGSSSIASISLAASLEGPTPWKVKGKAKLKLFWFLTIKVKFSKEWGSRRNTALDDIKVLPLLTAALGETGNWQAEIPSRSHLLVTLREMKTSSGAVVAHPFGTLSISQKVVPLNLEIDKFGNRKPSDANEFKIKSVTVGEGADAVSLDIKDVSEQFAPAQFLEMKDSDKLSSKSFEKYDGGVKVVESETLQSGDYAMREVEYELDYIDSQRNLRRWPVLVAPDAFAFNAWSTKGAIAGSPLSFAKNKKPALAPDSVKLTQEAYAIVNKSDLTVFDDQSTLAGEGAAISRLRQIVRENPAMATELEILPAFEVQS